MSDIFEEADEIEFEVVTMTDNDGAEVEFSIIDNVACGGGSVICSLWKQS